MKSVLILTNNDMGLYKFRKELLIELNKQYKVYISVPFSNFIDKLKDCGGEYLDIDINRRGINPFSDIKLLFKYFKLIKKFKPDIILTYTIKPNIYGGLAARIKRVPYLVNITGLGTAIESKTTFGNLLLKLYRFSVKKSKIVFFQNSANKDYFIKNQRDKIKYCLLPGSGVNIEEFSLLQYPKESGDVNLLFIGRIMQAKGIDELLEITKIFNKRGVIFTLVGPQDEDYQDILEEYQENGYINYVGETSDIKEYLLNSHAIIHPSHHEGMSNVLLEAAACGRPIIASNIPGCREIFDEEVSGLGFQVKNIDDMSRAVERFLKLSYEAKKQMGLNAREKVEKKYNRNIIINKYLIEIENLLGDTNELI